MCSASLSRRLCRRVVQQKDRPNPCNLEQVLLYRLACISLTIKNLIRVAELPQSGQIEPTRVNHHHLLAACARTPTAAAVRRRQLIHKAGLFFARALHATRRNDPRPGPGGAAAAWRPAAATVHIPCKGHGRPAVFTRVKTAASLEGRCGRPPVHQVHDGKGKPRESGRCRREGDSREDPHQDRRRLRKSMNSASRRCFVRSVAATCQPHG